MGKPNKTRVSPVFLYNELFFIGGLKNENATELKRSRNRVTGTPVTITTGRGIKIQDATDLTSSIQIEFIPVFLEEGIGFRILTKKGDIYIIGVTNQELRNYLSRYPYDFLIQNYEQDEHTLPNMATQWLDGIRDPYEKFHPVIRYKGLSEEDPYSTIYKGEINFTGNSVEEKDTAFDVYEQLQFASHVEDAEDNSESRW